MKPIPTELVFLSARRTPFGTYGGSLKDLSATELGVHAAKAAIAQSGVKPEDIDNVVFGNVVQTSADAIYLARHVGLRSGISMALVIVVVAEMFIGSDNGLGHRIIDAQQVLNVRSMYAAILAAGVLGYLLNILFLLIEKKVVHWSGR